MQDPRTGAIVYARYAIVPEAKPKRPIPRMLKCVWDGKRSVGFVYRLLRRILDRANLCEDYFSPRYGWSDSKVTKDTPWEELWQKNGGYRWIACYAVTGGNEGHYVHVELTATDKPSLGLFLGKTFQGMESAQQAASLLAVLLGA